MTAKKTTPAKATVSAAAAELGNGLDPSANPSLSEDDAEAEALAAEQAEAETQRRIDEAIIADRLKRDEEAEQAKEEAGVAPLTGGKRVTIMLEESDDIPPTGLFLGINGRSYMVRPGEEVEVPEEVVHCLNDAVMATPKTDQQGNVIDYRNRLRFPYRIIAGSL